MLHLASPALPHPFCLLLMMFVPPPRPCSSANSSAHALVVSIPSRQAVSLQRLRFTMSAIPPRTEETLNKLLSLMSSEGSYRCYRDLLQRCKSPGGAARGNGDGSARRVPARPFVPFIGIVISDIVHIEQAYRDSLLNATPLSVLSGPLRRGKAGKAGKTLGHAEMDEEGDREDGEEDDEKREEEDVVLVNFVKHRAMFDIAREVKAAQEPSFPFVADRAVIPFIERGAVVSLPELRRISLAHEPPTEEMDEMRIAALESLFPA